MRHADLAMYAAKKGGRGRYAVFHHDMGRELGELFGIEHELRLGLQRGEFSVHYQPQISLESREIVGVEALLRWRSPTRGAVPPGQFIPIAESTGLIQPLGEFVLREACDQTARWANEELLPEAFVVWVNVSAKQLTTGGVGKLVRSALAAAQIQPSRLGLEVTETAIVARARRATAPCASCRSCTHHGVRIAIDDFGTGFSSLAQLRRFPVDMIKVDRSFVQGIEHDARDEAITTHTVNLAHAIGVLALAEGVESTGQLASIDELGCDLAQGYLFAHPTPPDEVTAAARSSAADRAAAHRGDRRRLRSTRQRRRRTRRTCSAYAGRPTIRNRKTRLAQADSVRDLVALGMEEHTCPRAGGGEEREEELGRRDVAHAPPRYYAASAG